MSITRIKSYGISDGAITTNKISGDVSLGVKITSVQIANSSYSVLDDTAVALEGGYLVITGSGFASGCQVLIGSNNATSVTFVDSTTLRAQVGAADAGTKTIYVVNTDGGTAIRVNGLTYSADPTWVTDSTLPNNSVDDAISIQLNASGATSYQLQAGSTLPTGLTLAANGLLSGTVTGLSEDTLYNFNIVAIDDENQDSTRTFSLNIVLAIIVDYLVVAGAGAGGGGGPGGRPGGGGGAGGFRTGEFQIEKNTSYTVTVGSGGSTTPTATPGANGTSSIFATINTTGGGGGASGQSSTNHPGRSGGSGGGSQNGDGNGSIIGGTGNIGNYDPPEGNNGGGTLGQQGYFGGGGAGAASTNNLGAIGAVSSITGTSTYYAGGGGANRGAGGLGGGGNAGTNAAGAAGTVNTGGGGGGGDTGQLGGAGGSGVVILKYNSGFSISNPGGGLTFTTSTAVPGYKITTFTAGTGNIQFSDS